MNENSQMRLDIFLKLEPTDIWINLPFELKNYHDPAHQASELPFLDPDSCEEILVGSVIELGNEISIMFDDVLAAPSYKQPIEMV